MRALWFPVMALLCGAGFFPAKPPAGVPASGLVVATATTLYVNGASGSDNNACTASGASACATICGAYGKLLTSAGQPKTIMAPVTISVTPGTTYTGCRIPRFPLDGGGFVHLLGETGTGTRASAATPNNGATGSDPITAVTGTAGSNTVLGTVTVATATWPTAGTGMSGYILRLTAGTGYNVGGTAYRVIASNTATVLTLVGNFATLPTTTTSWEILDPALFFHINTTASNFPYGVNSTTLASVATSVGLFLGPSTLTGTSSGGGHKISFARFGSSVGTGFISTADAWTLSGCRFESSSIGISFSSETSAPTGTVQDSVFAGAATHIASGVSTRYVIQRNAALAGARFFAGSINAVANLSANYVPLVTGTVVVPSTWQIHTGNRWTGNTSASNVISTQSAGANAHRQGSIGSLSLTSDSFTCVGTAGVCAAAISLNGGLWSATAVGVTGNFTGGTCFEVNGGGRLSIDSATSMTCTSGLVTGAGGGSEIDIEAAASLTFAGGGNEVAVCGSPSATVYTRANLTSATLLSDSATGCRVREF